MPIFEYNCRKCNGSFELLVRSDTQIACPNCGSEIVVKKLSLFAAQVKRSGESVPACHTGECGCNLGKCGSGFCGVE
jgi:putative FmdB family regulatory protein